MGKQSPVVARSKLCKGLLNKCPPTRGGCGYRFTKDDKGKEACPKCGFDRHCPNPAVTGFDVCSSHGAGRPGEGRPGGGQIKHGRYSERLASLMPKAFGGDFSEALEERERLFEMLPRLAAMDAIFAQLAKRLGTGDNPRTFERVQSSAAQINQTLKDPELPHQVVGQLITPSAVAKEVALPGRLGCPTRQEC